MAQYPSQGIHAALAHNQSQYNLIALFPIISYNFAKGKLGLYI